jgi:hypothetical protein
VPGQRLGLALAAIGRFSQPDTSAHLGIRRAQTSENRENRRNSRLAFCYSSTLLSVSPVPGELHTIRRKRCAAAVGNSGACVPAVLSRDHGETRDVRRLAETCSLQVAQTLHAQGKPKVERAALSG